MWRRPCREMVRGWGRKLWASLEVVGGEGHMSPLFTHHLPSPPSPSPPSPSLLHHLPLLHHIPSITSPSSIPSPPSPLPPPSIIIVAIQDQVGVASYYEKHVLHHTLSCLVFILKQGTREYPLVPLVMADVNNITVVIYTAG